MCRRSRKGSEGSPGIPVGAGRCQEGPSEVQEGLGTPPELWDWLGGTSEVREGSGGSPAILGGVGTPPVGLGVVRRNPWKSGRGWVGPPEIRGG